jgi:hypothetical protein
MGRAQRGEQLKESSMNVEATREHRWLHRLVGEWRTEAEMECAPGQVQKSEGTESVRRIGELWVLCEGRSTMPDGDPATMLMTLGYDPQRKRYTGTWVGSMMTHLWIYDGTMDAGQKVLTLEAEGPAFDQTPGKMARYRDVIEWKSDDHRIMTSHVLGDNGEWTQFMTAHYHRTA